MNRSEIRAKKSLGQHFLKDKNIADKIVNALPRKTDGIILEIGPGTGILTEILLKQSPENYFAIEIDHDAVNYLLNNFPELSGKLFHQDFLSYDLKQLPGEKIYIIGNFPYNISSQIFFHLLNYQENVQTVVCMLQKEVAERICSKPNNKTYGILSVLFQIYYDIEYLFSVNETAFIPPPKVKSAVIRMQKKDVPHLNCNRELFFKIVKSAFNQRRKTMRNSLSSYIRKDIKHDLVFNLRPEQLAPQDFIKLTNLIENQKDEFIASTGFNLEAE